MAFKNIYFSFLAVQCLAFSLANILLEDPNLFPGHLQPLGEGRKKLSIETVEAFPSPQEFFKDYVNDSKPLLIKGFAKKSPAFKLWDNSYLEEHPESASAQVYTEPELKENRNKYGKTVTFKEFLNTYQQETIYLVDDLPKHLKGDVYVPPPLSCENTEHLFQMSLMWFSAGGTKSVLHQDFIDNINCLFRGTKRLLMIEKEKYKYKIPLDMAWQKYSEVDIDKVDYASYPSMREIDEFYLIDMEEGDCLFIPYTWTHQVNSAPNKETKQNIAVNVWFTHNPNHIPCNNSEPRNDLTLADVTFGAKDSGAFEPADVGRLIGNILEKFSDVPGIRVKDFVKVLYYFSSFPNLRNKHLFRQKSFRKLLRKMFKQLDLTGDRLIDHADIEKLKFTENGLEALQLHFDEILNAADSHIEFQTETERETAIRQNKKEQDDTDEQQENEENVDVVSKQNADEEVIENEKKEDVDKSEKKDEL